jgi:uncharacterized protein YbjT (DUF2867 family)
VPAVLGVPDLREGFLGAGAGGLGSAASTSLTPRCGHLDRPGAGQYLACLVVAVRFGPQRLRVDRGQDLTATVDSFRVMTTKEAILVSGATGNVGRPLVEQLLAAGHRVRALTRNPDKADLPAGAELFAGNLADTASLTDAFTGMTAAHLISFGDDYTPLTNGAELVELASKAGVRRMTVLKGDPEKTDLDRAVEASGIDHTYLAPVEFMSNTLEWADSIREEGIVRDAFPTIRSAMVHEADIASVAATALTTSGHAGKEYWLTGPEALTAPEKVRVLSEVLDREVTFVELTQEEIVTRWRQQGFSDEDIDFFVMMRTNPPEAGYTVLPTVTEVTGKPARTFAQWVKENRQAFST